LTDTKEIALYFEELIKHTSNYKSAANWIMGAIKGYLNDHAIDLDRETFPVKPAAVAALIALIDSGKVSNSSASQKIFPVMLQNPEKPVEQIAQELNVIQESDSAFIEGLVKEALAKYPAKVDEYRAGKKGLLGLFVGEVMKLSQGKADPKEANKIVLEHLDN
jgi:aspartyl-tRNA(Asn)/glutamyl-tRNA(Gln) amidotransferase subunit B